MTLACLEIENYVHQSWSKQGNPPQVLLPKVPAARTHNDPPQPHMTMGQSKTSKLSKLSKVEMMLQCLLVSIALR